MPQISAIALNPSKPSRINRNVDLLKTELPAPFWIELKRQGIIHEQFSYLP